MMGGNGLGRDKATTHVAVSTSAGPTIRIMSFPNLESAGKGFNTRERISPISANLRATSISKWTKFAFHQNSGETSGGLKYQYATLIRERANPPAPGKREKP